MTTDNAETNANKPRLQTDWSAMHFATRAIRSGQDPDPTTGSVVVPIYQTSTYRHDAVGSFKGYEYSRTGNPTRTALENALASLEGGAWGLAYASGTAAAQNISYLLNPGDHLLMSNDIYSGTYRFYVGTFARYGVATTVVDMTDPVAVAAAMRPETRIVWVETPTNPNIRITDIAAIAAIAHSGGALLIVDNTFSTPYLQQPLALDADLVLHSTTKYIGGHSDVIGGAIVGNDPDIQADLAGHQNSAGAVPGPFDCWLALRGLKTLSLRMDRHCENAMAIAEYLHDHPAIDEVFYPGLSSHKGHDIAKRQMRTFSGMVSFTTRGGAEKAVDVVQRTLLFLLAESLGGVESLIEHPAQITHISVKGSEVAVDPSLIRLSVGIEHAEDLIADLAQALA
ncbi:MAG: cystathionine gamma-synthase [Thermomicrobiales bacterium]